MQGRGSAPRNAQAAPVSRLRHHLHAGRSGVEQDFRAVEDLGEVERINSCGVRDWVNWLSQIEANNVKVVLVECSPAIVAQINLVNNFTGSGAVDGYALNQFSLSEHEGFLRIATTTAPPTGSSGRTTWSRSTG